MTVTCHPYLNEVKTCVILLEYLPFTPREFQHASSSCVLHQTKGRSDFKDGYLCIGPDFFEFHARKHSELQDWILLLHF